MDMPAEERAAIAPDDAPADSPDALESIRLQAEEHPLIDDAPPASASEHCLRLMHLKAYDEAAADASGADVLDVGCNTGYGTLRFLDVARRVVGVDVSPAAIDLARARAVAGRPEFLAVDGLGLPFPDGSFDLVISFQVLEHVADPLPYLREIWRVARPGGSVILTTPNAATRLDPGMTPWNRFHVHEYRASELHDMLSTVFPHVRVRGMFGPPTLYETEINRVDEARRRIRRREAAAAGSTLPARRPRPLPVRAARALLPASARGRIRSLLGSGGGTARSAGLTIASSPATSTADRGGTPSVDLETFLRFSVADLFYTDTDLDRAMDLMAVCRLD
jgi:SAM-dependent methyltransferase